MRFIITDKDPSRMTKCIHHLSALPSRKEWQVDIKEYTPNRSNAQNNTYWMWLGELAKFMGENKDELHDKFALKLIGYEEKEIAYRDAEGDVQTFIKRNPKSTKSLTVKEFSEYLAQVEVTILQAFPDFKLPYPDDYKYALNG